MALIRFTFGVEPSGPQFDRIMDLRFGEITNFKPIFEDIAKDVYSDIKANFESGGGNVGGWQPLSERYAIEKAADYRAGRIPYNKIMYRTGRLAASLTDKEAPEAICEITDRSLEIGTQVPYAIWHQIGTRTMPQRLLIALKETTRAGIVRRFQKASLAAQRSAGLPLE